MANFMENIEVMMPPVSEMAIGPSISQSFYHMDTQYSMHGASTSRRQLTRTTLARTYFTLFASVEYPHSWTLLYFVVFVRAPLSCVHP